MTGNASSLTETMSVLHTRGESCSQHGLTARPRGRTLRVGALTVLTHIERSALTGIVCGASAGAIRAAMLFSANPDILDTPVPMVLGVAQAAVVDACALWLLLAACGMVVGLVSAAAGWRLASPERPLHVSVAAGAVVLAFILAARLREDPLAATTWGAALGGALATAAAVFLLLPGVSRRWSAIKGMGPALIAVVPLAAAGAWATAYIRFGLRPGDLWPRVAIAAGGVLVALAVIGAGARWLPPLAGRAARWWRPVAATLPAPALAVVVMLWASGARSAPAVIVITIDTLRADRLGCYGSQAGLTPNLDRFARDAIVFENAFAQSPWTANSFATMFTGRYLRDIESVPADWTKRLPTPSMTFSAQDAGGAPLLLPEIMREAGYATAAEITNPYLDQKLGWDRGFDYFRNEHSVPPERIWLRPTPPQALLGWRHASLTGWFARRSYVRPANKRIYGHTVHGREQGDRLTAAATQWLSEHGSRAPFFLWVHYMDPHEPYLAPDLPAEMEAKLDPGSKEYLRRARGGMVCNPSPVQAPAARTPPLSTGAWIDRGEPRPTTSESVRAATRMMYGYEVRYADRCVGRLLDRLRRAGLYERALIIVTADHGEELWDHGKLGHGHALYDEILQVPLLLKLPGLARGQRVQRQVRLLDVMPTVLEVAGVSYRGPLRGRSLLKALEPDDEDRPLFAEGVIYGEEQKCVRTARYKVIAHGATRRFEVYDLRADPAEKRDLGANQRIAAAERALLTDWMTAPTRRASGPAADPPMTPQVLDALRSLGYVAH